jgi:hypothetical protein
LAALFVVDGIARGPQLIGIAVTVAFALIAGFIAGKVLAIFGRRAEPYVDKEEFAD